MNTDQHHDQRLRDYLAELKEVSRCPVCGGSFCRTVTYRDRYFCGWDCVKLWIKSRRPRYCIVHRNRMNCRFYVKDFNSCHACTDNI